MRKIAIEHPAIVEIRVIGDAEAPDDDNLDVFVELNDGRCFSFTVFTPANVIRHMQGRLSFVSPGMLIVHRITDEAIIEAVLDAYQLGIQQFGVLQR
ncbi:MAG TPA: hypothetical protein VIX73_05095 [Kofleriaceae bacterium]|jgi:hypothetical protein